jgi:hypothetical protein
VPRSQSRGRQIKALQGEPGAAHQGVLEGVGLPCYNGGLNITLAARFNRRVTCAIIPPLDTR